MVDIEELIGNSKLCHVATPPGLNTAPYLNRIVQQYGAASKDVFVTKQVKRSYLRHYATSGLHVTQTS